MQHTHCNTLAFLCAKLPRHRVLSVQRPFFHVLQVCGCNTYHEREMGQLLMSIIRILLLCRRPSQTQLCFCAPSFTSLRMARLHFLCYYCSFRAPVLLMKHRLEQPLLLRISNYNEGLLHLHVTNSFFIASGIQSKNCRRTIVTNST